MVFGGAKISAPAMAAAHGMKEIALHQVTNRQVRPLMAQAAGTQPIADPAAIPAGSMELAGHMLPSSPDLVPFPEVPRARPAKFTGLPRAPVPRLPQMPAGSAVPQMPAGPAMPQRPTGSAESTSRTARPDPSVLSGGPPADPAAAAAEPPAAAPPDDLLDEATIRPGVLRPAGRKRSA